MITGIKLLGRHVSNSNIAMSSAWNFATSDTMSEAIVSTGVGAGFAMLGAKLGIPFGPVGMAIGSVAGTVLDLSTSTSGNVGKFVSDIINYDPEFKYVPRPDIWHGPEEWRGKAQQEKAWDQDYNKNGEYEAEQNIRNGSYTPDRNGSDRRKKYKEFWSKPENKKRAEEDGANDLNGPEALNRPAVKQNPTVTNNSKSGSDRNRDSGSDRNRDRNSGSGSSRDRYRDSRNSNDSGRFGPPIILDLDGDGVELTALDESSTFYDISGDGYRNKIGWADKDDGILAFDKNSDGFIQDRDEIAFVDYKEGAETDLEGLTAFDSNNDGVLDNKDKQWNQFGVWQDHDQDGISDEGEFKSLDEMGITSIDLSSDGEEHDNNGNIVYGLGSYTRSDGSTHTFADTGLQYSDFSYRTNDDDSIDIKTGDTGIKMLSDDSDNTFTVSDGELDIVFGGSGSDTITVDTKHDIILDGGSGDDYLVGGDGNDWLIGGEGADRLEGGAGSDLLFIDRLDLARGEIDGGEGFDTAIISGDETIEIDARQHNLEAIYSSSGNDKLSASGDVGVMLYGGDGDDMISGSSGADLLQGDAGADIINGGEGDDYLIVDELDTWHGGHGYDTAVFNSTNDLNIDLRQHSVERLIAGDGNDTIVSGEANNIISSGGGDDTINSGAGSDTVLAGEGNDQIKAGDGADFLYGGQGNDDLQGGAGDDTYFFARGDGQDSILDQSIQNVTETYTQTVKRRRSFGKFSFYVNEKRTRTRTVAKEVDGGDDTLQMGATISMSDLFATTQSDRLTIRLNKTSGSDQLSEDAVTVRNWSDSKNRIEFIELDTGEVFDISKVGLAVSGSEGNDVISLASGQPSSPNKKDAVWFNGGGGNDVITGGSLADFLFGGNGQDTLNGYGGDDYISGNSGDDRIYAGSGDDDVFGGIGNDRIDAGSGNDYLHGEAGDDHLIGGSGNDVLVGGVGSDRLEGGQGNDTYILNRGDGRDQILDKYIGQVTTAYTYTRRVYKPKPSGKSGRWVNERRTGYRKSMSELDGGSDTLQFGAGISVSDVLVQHSGANLFVGLKDDRVASASEALDRVEVLEWADKKNRVETFRFSDGLSIDMSDVRYAWTGGDSADKFKGTHEGDWLSGNAGNDHLFGQFGNDVLIGGSGNDFLEGGAGNDTYIVNRGDGKDTIYDDHRVTETQRYTYYERVLKQGYKSSYYVNEKRTGTKTVTKQNDAGEDILLFGKDISFEDIVLQSSGSHLLVGLGHSDQNENISDLEDVVTIKDWSNKNNRIELFQFEDGTDVDMSLIQSASTGSSYNETLNGNINSNWLDGSGGNDTINAGSGNDIIWGGFGADKLIGGAGNDQLYGQDGNDVLTDASGNNLFMAGTGDDTLTGGNGVDILLGEAGSDTINGGHGDDHLLGGAGNDILIGGEGNDTYYFTYGDGQDVVRNSDSAGKDTLTFDGISSDNVWFERRGNDLVVSLLGASDEVKFESWFTKASARIDTFTDASGVTLAASQVNKLIEVMSGYQANDGASFEGVLPNSLPYEVQIAVDSAWRSA